MSQHVFWVAILFFAIQLHKPQCFTKEYHLFSSVVECAFSGGFTPSSNRERISFCWIGFCARDDFKHSEVRWRQTPSVALAGPLRVNDNLQTGPTVYKSGTLVEVAPRAFFCQSPDASPNHWLGLSRDISDPTTHRFAKRNGFRESFSNTQCLVCIS